MILLSYTTCLITKVAQMNLFLDIETTKQTPLVIMVFYIMPMMAHLLKNPLLT